MRQLARGVWKNAWIVVAVAVAVVAVSLLRSTLQTQIWSSTAVVRILNASSTSLLPDQSKVDPAREVELQRLFATSAPVVQGVNGRLGPDAAKIDSVAITGVATADALQFQVSSQSRVIAQNAANAYADSYVEAHRRDIDGVLKAQVDKLRRDATAMSDQMAAIDKQLADNAPAVTLDTRGVPVVAPETETAKSLRSNRDALAARAEETNKQATQLETESAVRQDSIAVVSPAPRPKQPSQPTPLRDAGVAFVLGTFVGLVLALVRSRYDDRITTADDAEGLVPNGAGVVSVPHNPEYPTGDGDARLPLEDRGSLEREAYRALRTSLLFGQHGAKPSRRVLVTSPNQGDGKTTTAANLAVSMATSGRRVVVIDCDLRRPRLHAVFGLKNDAGLVSVIRDGVALQSALKTVELPDSQPLDVLTAGPTSDNPAELLMSHTVAAILDRFSEHYDLVICDSSPLLAVADALPLAGMTDGVVLVARSGHTRRREFSDAVAQLDQVGAGILAVLLSQVRTTSGQYARYYGPDAPPARRASPTGTTSSTPTGRGPTAGRVLRPGGSPGRSARQG